jgi:hypothetical protein
MAEQKHLNDKCFESGMMNLFGLNIFNVIQYP